MDRGAFTARIQVAASVLATVLRDHAALVDGPIDGLLADAEALLLQHESGPAPQADYGFPAPSPGGLVGAVRHAAREIQRAAAAAELSAAAQAEISERVTLSVLVAEYHANTLLRRL